MTESEFRQKHSEIIGYYQLIEMRLKGICAHIFKNGEKNWFDRLGDYEPVPFGKLIMKIKDGQVKRQIILFSEEDFDALDKLREDRNYWVHRCFIDDTCVTFPRGELRRIEHGKRLENDLNEAIDWDKRLTGIFNSHVKPEVISLPLHS